MWNCFLKHREMNILPIGQNFVKQFRVETSIFDELQFWPPKSGEGLVQVLVRVSFPSPHVKLQELHSDQSVQFPSVNCKQKISCVGI